MIWALRQFSIDFFLIFTAIKHYEPLIYRLVLAISGILYEDEAVKNSKGHKYRTTRPILHSLRIVDYSLLVIFAIIV